MQVPKIVGYHGHNNQQPGFHNTLSPPPLAYEIQLRSDHFTAGSVDMRIVPKIIGYHGHNNQQLGFANSVEAVITGVEMVDGQQLGFANSVADVITGVEMMTAVNWGVNEVKDVEMVDGSYLGMGRGSGNTCLEQLLCFFKNPKFDVRPVLEAIEKHLIPLRTSGVEWGVSIPYLIQVASLSSRSTP
ncbi:hypothetical protein T484DRAFT_1853324 [Baffinella frigidus]|nr:hypothetical protein T484DRAFT_1853324 [Cryptophyta sp. CCMP2293]